MLKRALDLLIASLGLLLLAPFFLAIAVLIKLDSKGPVLFSQKRLGRNFTPFRIYKFRSMSDGPAQRDRPITYGDDPRITRMGRILRASKIDELPQLINVLKGDMSLVGPRPELPRYVEMFRDDYEEILKLRPGITDMASLRYRNEAEILGASPNPQDEYVQRILPKKIKLAKEYLRQSSLLFDIQLIAKTLWSLFRPR